MTSQTVLINASYAPSLLQFRGALLQRMVQAGHRVHASAPDLAGPIAADLRALGVSPHDVPLARTGLNPWEDLQYRRAIRCLVDAHRIDLVMGYTIKPCIWGSLAARDSGVASVSLVTGLGYAFTAGRSWRQRAVSAVSRRLWRHATAANRAVIFQNPDDRDDFIAAGALADVTKARLVNGSGVDMASYPKAPLPAAANFLMIARLLGNKGVREYAEAAASLIKEGVDARFTLVGYHDEGPDGIAEADLARWCASGLDYAGAQEDVRPALAACSVFVLPSYREGTPRTVLEAMATGRPIITSTAPGCRETIVDGESGILVPARDAGALADAMRRLAGATALRQQMGEAAWERCSARYQVDHVNAQMMRHLQLDDMTPPAPAVGADSAQWKAHGNEES